jgi:predicted Fe-S protein YdhL (DUF1289 family)
VNPASRTASSPCVNICVIDPVSGLCAGCGRTLAEIARWATMSEPERLSVMALLPERLKARN